MYEDIKSRLVTTTGVSSYFPCVSGVRQGETLALLLFSLHLNVIAKGIGTEAQTYELFLFLKVYIVLYADDTVLISGSNHELQSSLNIFCIILATAPVVIYRRTRS